MHDPLAIIDTKLFWIPCTTESEANYLTAVINSRVLEQAAAPLRSKGQFGSRDLQKHLWRLPIPEYDETEALHRQIAAAGAGAATGAAAVLRGVQAARAAAGKTTSATVARRELRAWLAVSEAGRRVEHLVTQLRR